MIDDFNDQKAFDLKAYWEIAVRRRRMILAPLFVIGLGAMGIALVWPAVYRSEALIQVERQEIPQRYVTPNVVSDTNGGLESMTQQILSRTRLESLIKQFNLYRRERTRGSLDDAVDKMRADITIQVVQPAATSGRDDQPTTFKVSYSSESARSAQEVNSELTSLFIEKTLETRAQQSASTTTFLQNELEAARKDLAQQEEQLRQYKMRYLGELPQQEASNLQILNSLQVQLQASTDALGRAEQQRIYLESLRSEYQARAAADSKSGAGAAGEDTEATLSDLRKKLVELQAKYTPQHPDVIRLQQQIADLEKRKDNGKDAVASADSRGTKSAADQPAVAEVMSRLKAIEVEINNDKQQGEKLKKQIEEIETRLSLTPVREQQLADVTRNYQNSRENYQSLLEKKMQSELATNLEKRKEGEQFRIIDPPSLPDKPYKPNRPLIILGGWALGLAAGLSVAGLREITDTTVRTEEDLKEQVKAPILARIPVLYSERQMRYRRTYQLLEMTTIVLLSLFSLAFAAYIYRMS